MENYPEDYTHFWEIQFPNGHVKKFVLQGTEDIGPYIKKLTGLKDYSPKNLKRLKYRVVYKNFKKEEK
jgi:hypothetical protein